MANWDNMKAWTNPTTNHNRRCCNEVHRFCSVSGFFLKRHIWSFGLGKTVFVDLSNWREARLNVKTKEQRKDLRLRLRKSRQLQNGFAEGNLPPLLYGGRSKGSFYFHKLFIREQQCANISLKREFLKRRLGSIVAPHTVWLQHIKNTEMG